MKVSLTQACKILKQGGIVAIPTETIYGLAGDAFCVDAVKKIYESKGRPSQNPLIVHIAKMEDLEKLAYPPTELEKTLMQAFWPGPLSFILKKKPEVPDITSGGLDSIAVRMPSHPITQKILEKSGLFLAAPSANPSGRTSPTHHEHVEFLFENKIPTIHAKACPLGMESSVIRVENKEILLLREGAISQSMLEAFAPVKKIKKDPRSPGSQFKHYAPISPITSATLEQALTKKLDDYFVISLDEDLKKLSKICPLNNKISLGKTQASAQKLYASLFCADQSQKTILVILNENLGSTLLERISRACEA